MRTLIASRDQPLTVRCPADNEDELRWMKQTSALAAAAAAAADDDGRWVEVSRRRRLVLDAGVKDRDGVYLCVIMDRSSSSSSALLAANVTILSPCKTRTP